MLRPARPPDVDWLDGDGTHRGQVDPDAVVDGTDRAGSLPHVGAGGVGALGRDCVEVARCRLGRGDNARCARSGAGNPCASWTAHRLDRVSDLCSGHAEGRDEGELIGVFEPGPAQLRCLVVDAVEQDILC